VLLCDGTVAPSRIAAPIIAMSPTTVGVEWTPISPVSRSICSLVPLTTPTFKSTTPLVPNPGIIDPVFALRAMRRYPVVT
jgi:hypothetical protein